MLSSLRKLFCLIAFSISLPAVESESYPVIVLGGGIGALTSAIYLGRAQIQPVVIEGKSPGGALVQSHSVQNWPGELDISGADLIAKIHAHAEQSGALFLQDEVIAVDFSKRPFTITTRSVYNQDKTRILKAETVVIAMGSSSKFLGIPGERKYWAKGVYSCALCDGSLYRNRTVAVVGGGDAAITEAHYLANIAKKVILVVRGSHLRVNDAEMQKQLFAKSNVEVRMETTVSEIIGNEDQVTDMIINSHDSKETLPIDGLFLAIGSRPNTKLFEKQIALDEKGFIITNEEKGTSVPGVFAIGDITGKSSQALTAAAEGAESSMHIPKYLKTAPTPIVVSSQKPLASPPVVEVNSLKQFEEELRSSEHPVLVDFYATWCGPCKQIAPRFEALSKTCSGQFKFIKVNVDRSPELSNYFKIRAMPTLLLIDKEGKIAQRKVGADEIAHFAAALEKK